jgi:uncharacterized protein YndB with AHSA1/START domain
MLKKILLVLGLVIVALLVVIATRPDTYHVERSLDIDAPAAIVFTSVGDLKNYAEWSPWEKRDPAMKKTFSTATAGVGASYAWEGNKEVGKGKMSITESRPPERLVQKLEFIEPFPATSDVAFDLKPAGNGGTRVTWSMDGKSNFMGKAFSLVMSMDQAVGKDFEEGLANLKRVSEAKHMAEVKKAAEAAAAAAAVAAKAAADAAAAVPAPPAPVAAGKKK